MRRAALFGALAVLIFDTLASFASRELGFPYEVAGIGSAVIYGLIGSFAAREGTIRAGAAAAALAGVVDATAGWWISIQIGPGLSPDSMQGPLGVAISVVFMVLFAAALGTMGAFLRVAWPTRSGSVS